MGYAIDDLPPDKAEEDHGMEYSECKAVITHKNKVGKDLSELTTWRGDTIQNILRASNLDSLFQTGDSVTITIEKSEQT